MNAMYRHVTAPSSRASELACRTANGRPGQPAEIAPLYVALASSETSHANGQVWGADGGLGIF